MMTVTITTIERTVYSSDKVSSINIPTKDGRITVLTDHEALISAAGIGEVEITTSDAEVLPLFIDGGVIQIFNNNVEILAESAEKADELEEAKIQEAIRHAQQILAQRPEDTDLAHTESILRREMEKFKYLQKWQNLKR